MSSIPRIIEDAPYASILSAANRVRIAARVLVVLGAVAVGLAVILFVVRGEVSESTRILMVGLAVIGAMMGGMAGLLDLAAACALALRDIAIAQK